MGAQRTWTSTPFKITSQMDADSRRWKKGQELAKRCRSFGIVRTMPGTNSLQQGGFEGGFPVVHLWGAHAPSRVVFGALAEDGRFSPFHAVFDEGVEVFPGSLVALEAGAFVEFVGLAV